MTRFRLPTRCLLAIEIGCITLLVTACNQGGSAGSVSSTASAASKSSTTAQAVSAVALSASKYSISQNAGSVTVTVTRSGSTSSAASVDYATSNSSAVAGTDYSSATGTLRWSAGDATPKTLSVPVSNATPFSGTKTFDFILTNPSSSTTIGSPGSAAVTITGDSSAASPGTLELSDATDTVAQGATSVTISVDRVDGSGGAVTVEYATGSGTASSGTDYTATSGTLQWAGGDDSVKTFTVPLVQEPAFSGSRTFTVSLSSPSGGATLGSPYSETISITGSQSASAGTFQLSTSAYSVDQSTGSVTVTVDRIGGSNGATSLSYATTNGTAVAGSDYTATSGTLHWTNGDTTAQMFSIPVSTTTAFTGTKTFTVALNSPSAGAAISSPGSETVTISGASGGSPGTLDLSASTYSVSQSAGSVTITVDRTGGSTGAVAVSYATTDGTATAGTDYTSTSGTLSWASGDSSAKTFAVAVSNATPLSQTKTFNVNLSSATGGASLSSPNSATVDITSNSTDWVYYDGVFNWPGDWSFSATPNYRDTAGGPIEGPYDIAVTVTGQWGAWQPYAPGESLDTTPYKYLIFSLKPTVANQVWDVGFMSAGDTPDGTQAVNIAPYGPAGGPVVGQWGSYKIPISAFSLTDTTVLKFWIQDDTGRSTNLFYVDNVGFTTN